LRFRLPTPVASLQLVVRASEVHDVILAQLVDAVVSDGVASLLTKDSDSLASHRTSVDAVSHLITHVSKKETDENVWRSVHELERLLVLRRSC
jgi:hypothetical protein